MADVQGGAPEDRREECDACFKPAVHEVIATYPSGEPTKANLCIPHAQLAHNYKHDWTPIEERVPGKPNFTINEDKEEEFLKTARKPEGRELGERLCGPDRNGYRTRRLTREETMGIELGSLRRPDEPERGMSL